MTADVPDDLRLMLDHAAGRTHSADGIVMTTLGCILAEHKRQILAETPACADALTDLWAHRNQYGLYGRGYRDAIRDLANKLGVDLDSDA